MSSDIRSIPPPDSSPDSSSDSGLDSSPDANADRAAAAMAFETGKIAFERGDYRQSMQSLEQAQELSDRRSALGGAIQVWLVTAYEAAGQQDAAIALCRAVSRHPDHTARTQAKRLLCILEAPRLQIRPEWTTPIPDLTTLSDNAGYSTRGASQFVPKTTPKAPPKPLFELPEPLPPEIPRDNKFIWLALGLTVLTCGSLALWNALS